LKSFQWTRIDPEARNFHTTKDKGPDWNKIYRRTTINNTNNEIVQDLTIDRKIDIVKLSGPLPPGVTHTTTIFFYHDSYENLNKDVSESHNINLSYQFNANSHWQKQYDKPFSFSLHTTIDEYLSTLSYDELIGYHTSFETFAYVITAVEKLQQLEDLQPKLAWKPLEVIKKTLEATTQWAITTSHFPMKKHHVSRFAWNNRTRLKEIVSMDTIFSPVTGYDGSNCSQVFFGIMSCMLNVYHMPSKESVHVVKDYQDFMRYEGVPDTLHRDMVPEQKTQEIIDINRCMIVKDTWAEPG